MRETNKVKWNNKFYLKILNWICLLNLKKKKKEKKVLTGFGKYAGKTWLIEKWELSVNHGKSEIVGEISNYLFGFYLS